MTLSLLDATSVSWRALQFEELDCVKLWVAQLSEPFRGVSGNKLAKLHHPLLSLQQSSMGGIATFGGAFSNHLLAVAVACHQLGKISIGFVRSDSGLDPNNPTLSACQRLGMKLIALDRQSYRQRHDQDFVRSLLLPYPNFLYVPEGGTSAQGVTGVERLDFSRTPSGKANVVACAVGSGGTLAGLVNGHSDTTILGIAAVRDKSLLSTITKLARNDNWQLNFDYTNKGFGRFGKAELHVMARSAEQGVVLEPIYTAKALLGILDLAKKGKFAPESTLALFHTGGLQGLNGAHYRGLIDDELFQRLLQQPIHQPNQQPVELD